jgi:hypothetical protein
VATPVENLCGFDLLTAKARNQALTNKAVGRFRDLVTNQGKSVAEAQDQAIAQNSPLVDGTITRQAGKPVQTLQKSAGIIQYLAAGSAAHPHADIRRTGASTKARRKPQLIPGLIHKTSSHRFSIFSYAWPVSEIPILSIFN